MEHNSRIGAIKILPHEKLFTDNEYPAIYMRTIKVIVKQTNKQTKKKHCTILLFASFPYDEYTLLNFKTFANHYFIV